MGVIKRIIVLTLTIAFLVPFVSYAREGMSSAGGLNGDVWMYFTGEEKENGMPECLINEWKQVWDNWYYFGDDGKSIQSAWKEIDGKWYYFDEYSIMLHDTTTPDGYYVGSDGAWVQEETAAQ